MSIYRGTYRPPGISPVDDRPSRSVAGASLRNSGPVSTAFDMDSVNCSDLNVKGLKDYYCKVGCDADVAVGN